MHIAHKFRLLLIAVSIAAALASSLQAGLVSTVSASGQYFGSLQSLDCSGTNTDLVTAAAACSIDASLDVFHSASGLYQANSEYGSLDAQSSSSSYGGRLSGTATASFSDTLLATGGSGSGTLVFTVTYWGYGSSDAGDAGNYMNSHVTFNDFSAYPTHALDASYTTQLEYGFTFGTPFAFTAYASAYSSALGNEMASQNAHLRIDSIGVLDSSGSAISDNQIQFGSEQAYLSTAPEPRTCGLFVVSALAFLINRRNRFVIPIRK
jgi:hypothetical protein